MGGAEDAERLTAYFRTGDAATRAAAVPGLARLGRLTDADLLHALTAGSAAVAEAAMQNLPERHSAAVRTQLLLLANHRHPPVAEEARRCLARFRPSDPPGQARFDLQTENLYVRLRLLETLSAAKEAWAIEIVEESVENSDPQVRADAITRLAELAPERARKKLPALLDDGYHWTRLHAAAVAARLATAELAEACRRRRQAESDAVIRAYLDDALARAEGRPLPQPPPPVKSFDPQRTTFGNCGAGRYADRSPVGYYYLLDNKVSDATRKLLHKDRIVLVRANHTAGNPVYVLFHSTWRDRWWQGLEEELSDAGWLDGVVLGEESMYTRPWTLWDTAWRTFCHEARIDPEKIAGQRERLAPLEQQAFLQWEEQRAVDGLNRMYDFLKLYFGKLRPGFLVATFLPDQNGPLAGDRRWKFDVGAAYEYGASNRERYNRIRRFKTMWPERPVMWLVMNNTGSAHGVRYDVQVPTDPAPLGHRAYSHSVAAWLAGADPGLFSVWLFVERTVKGPDPAGAWVHLEDVGPGSPTLAAGIQHAMHGVEAWQRVRAGAKEAPQPTLDSPGPTGKPIADLLEDPAAKPGHGPPDAIRQADQAQRKRLELGFLLEQKHLYDLARVFDGLPRVAAHPDVLLVAPFNSPVTDIASAHDFLSRIDQLGNVDLGRYRLIGLAGWRRRRWRTARSPPSAAGCATRRDCSTSAAACRWTSRPERLRTTTGGWPRPGRGAATWSVARAVTMQKARPPRRRARPRSCFGRSPSSEAPSSSMRRPTSRPPRGSAWRMYAGAITSVRSGRAQPAFCSATRRPWPGPRGPANRATRSS